MFQNTSMSTNKIILTNHELTNFNATTTNTTININKLIHSNSSRAIKPRILYGLGFPLQITREISISCAQELEVDVKTEAVAWCYTQTSWILTSIIYLGHHALGSFPTSIFRYFLCLVCQQNHDGSCHVDASGRRRRERFQFSQVVLKTPPSSTEINNQVQRVEKRGILAEKLYKLLPLRGSFVRLQSWTLHQIIMLQTTRSNNKLPKSFTARMRITNLSGHQ